MRGYSEARSMESSTRLGIEANEPAITAAFGIWV